MLGVGETADYPVILANLEAHGALASRPTSSARTSSPCCPNSPNPRSGAVFLVAPDRVRPAGVSLAAAMGALRRCGIGAGALLGELAVVGPA